MIRTYVSALRQSLRLPRHDGLPRLATLGDAYCLEVAPADLDMLVFDDLAERGRRALGDLLRELGETDAAHGSWREALAIFEELDDPQSGELRSLLSQGELSTSSADRCNA